MNRLIATITFAFSYDGTTQSIVVDTRKGAVSYQIGSSAASLHPLFAVAATGVENVTMGGIQGSQNQSLPTTATINNGVLTVAVPSGLSAGYLYVSATLLF